MFIKLINNFWLSLFVFQIVNPTGNGSLNYDCGLQNIESRVYNGKDISPHKYPWMAFIRIRRDGLIYRCGGTLIDERHVISAAHCFMTKSRKKVDPDDIRVSLGASSFNDMAKTWRTVEDVHIDVLYDIDSLINDLAILKLRKPIQFSRQISPICLPAESKISLFGDLVVTGWGRTHTKGPSVKIPQEGKLKMIDYRICNQVKRKYFKDFLHKRITMAVDSTHLCAVGENGTDTCTGDSGSPLMHQDLKTGRWILAGIVSGGWPPLMDDQCQNDGTVPGLYTRVGLYRRSIERYTDNPTFIPIH
ncbi:transmembrane protease serine 11C-like [Brevipalpus obovatus]|uniref:transmembrane protease serine 11C-like n=1 Tax=Brevipalpus obovatus TaxID=246614 RepID=UPI003D9F816F